MNERGEPRVLVVDDEPPIRELVRSYLAREGMEVSTATDGPSALEAVRAFRPDLVVLDLMLPGLDGIEVCRQLRTFSDAYVIMLTARDEEVDRIVGLSIGADDYVVKPFSPRELVARVRAVLRRARTPGSSEPVPGLEVDVTGRLVTVDGSEIRLTNIEFALLVALVGRPGVVHSRADLIDRVWGPDFVGDDHVLDVHVANLRRKLGDDRASPRFVETVRGIGFRLVTG
ncbi:MAG TPA: response regulator transcription factor [Candidatus Limnocylindria bacterium]|nr:response regulator transcription factor [Candidatus Limnocylindria bacterium]